MLVEGKRDQGMSLYDVMALEKAIIAAKIAAEDSLGFRIPDGVANSVLMYADRKRRIARKPESYLPLLYENELTDFFARMEINLRGVQTNV